MNRESIFKTGESKSNYETNFKNGVKSESNSETNYRTIKRPKQILRSGLVRIETQIETYIQKRDRLYTAN